MCDPYRQRVASRERNAVTEPSSGLMNISHASHTRAADIQNGLRLYFFVPYQLFHEDFKLIVF